MGREVESTSRCFAWSVNVERVLPCDYPGGESGSGSRERFEILGADAIDSGVPPRSGGANNERYVRPLI